MTDTVTDAITGPAASAVRLSVRQGGFQCPSRASRTDCVSNETMVV